MFGVFVVVVVWGFWCCFVVVVVDFVCLFVLVLVGAFLGFALLFVIEIGKPPQVSFFYHLYARDCLSTVSLTSIASETIITH